MRLATESQNPTDKIEYYRALLRKYPSYPRADEAQFMIGFVYSEELHDFEKAKLEYEKVLANYPASTLRESVQYMIQNMGHGSLPDFQDNPVPAPPPSGDAK
jgi:TolA-binding protein